MSALWFCLGAIFIVLGVYWLTRAIEEDEPLYLIIVASNLIAGIYDLSLYMKG